MSNIWKAFYHLNGDGESVFGQIEFEIPAEMMPKIQAALNEGVPLGSCDFYRELYDLAESSITPPDSYTEDDEEFWDEFYEEEPDPDEFDSEEEYEEALEEYNEAKREYIEEREDNDEWDSWSLEDVSIYDPGDYDRFKKQFIGRMFDGLKGKPAGEIPYVFEYSERISARYSLILVHDGEGMVTDIKRIDGVAMESESVRSSSWSECYPDFDFMGERLEKTLRYVTAS